MSSNSRIFLHHASQPTSAVARRCRVQKRCRARNMLRRRHALHCTGAKVLGSGTFACPVCSSSPRTTACVDSFACAAWLARGSRRVVRTGSAASVTAVAEASALLFRTARAASRGFRAAARRKNDHHAGTRVGASLRAQRPPRLLGKESRTPPPVHPTVGCYGAHEGAVRPHCEAHIPDRRPFVRRAASLPRRCVAAGPPRYASASGWAPGSAASRGGRRRLLTPRHARWC